MSNDRWILMLALGRILSLLGLFFGVIGLIGTNQDPYLWLLIAAVIIYTGTTIGFHIVTEGEFRRLSHELEKLEAKQ